MSLRTLGLAAIFAFAGAGAGAENLIPERQMTFNRDVDFYGSDLTNIFDTTLESCIRACLIDGDCKAFTFNTLSAACFPKSDVTKREPYEGAVSVQVRDTPKEVLTRASERRAAASFLTDRDLEYARRQAAGMGQKYAANSFTAQQFVDAALQSRNEGKPEVAMRFIGSALTLEDRSDLWAQFARDARAVAESDRRKRRDFNRQALGAAVNAYLRAPDPAASVNALTLMATALEKTGSARRMIAPLRLAQALQPRDTTASALDRALRLYGFNLSQTNVESNAAEPRICVVFNEALAEGVDFAPFVRSQIEGVSVEAEGEQLCLGGLQHGSRYAFTLREGLPAASGETLRKSIEIAQYVRDRAPSVRFPGRAYILPSTGDAALPIVAVNAETLDLTLFKVTDRNILRTMQNNFFAKPLSRYDEQEFLGTMGVEVWQGTGAVQSELNRDVTSRLPMREIVGDMTPGVYALKAAIPGPATEFNAPATQWFVISDLGVTTMQGTDGLHVFVRGLSDAAARGNVEVSLLSRANEVLETIATDADGYALFAPGLVRGKGAAAPGLLTVSTGDDFAFLSLTDPEFDLSDRGVEGRPSAPPVDVFLTTERGAYRAGETIHALALARDTTADAIPDLPLTAILKRPDGVEHSRVIEDDFGAGGRMFALPLAPTVPRGTWTLSVHADPDAPALADQRLLVEDFLPERIDATLTLPEGPISPSTPPQLSVEARYLFGAPGANLAVDGDVIVKPAKSNGYRYGRHDAQMRRQFGRLVSSGRTDAAGRLIAQLDLPELAEVMQPLEAELIVRVREGSNRPIERRLTRDLTVETPLIGVKPDFDGVVPEGGEAPFSIAYIQPPAGPASLTARWTVSRVRTEYQWYSNYGDWYWDPVTTRSRVATGEVSVTPGEPVQIAVPVEWGEYELKVESMGDAYVATSLMFSAGWYASADAARTPDLLDVSLDKETYRAGDTATLRLVPRHAGTALVTVLSNRLIDMKAVAVTEGENLIEMPVTDAWGSGAYVSASVLRPMDSEADQNPGRALGLSHAKIDPDKAQLAAQFEVAPESSPRGPLTARLRVETHGQDTYAMIAAVDQGILNLTSFEPPSASDHYFGQRKLGVAIRDVYGRLIDGTRGALGTVRSGGDATAQMRSQSPPPEQDLVTYVSGPIKVDTNGLAEATFDLPAFNGTVRLMAVVWSAEGVGEANAEVLVRDPVVATATLPRFLAPGDQSQLLLEVVHADGPAGTFPLRVTVDGATLNGVPGNVTLAPQGTARVTVPFTAGQAGAATFDVALTLPDGRSLDQRHVVDIRRNDPVIQRRSQFNLAAGSTFTVDQNAFSGFAAGSASVTLAAGPMARFDVPGMLNALDQYPYGCTEQVTSKALPLLYLDQVASAMGLAARDNIATRISQSIQLVLTNQASNGSFGLWRPDRGDLWLDAYVTDFLSRARQQGHDVPHVAFRQALDNLRNAVNSAPDFEWGGEGLAYALLVLTREGAAAIGDLRYYADVKAADFGSALAAAQLGTALAAYGDPTRADSMFRRASQMLEQPERNMRKWRDDYGSDLRDAAAVLTLAVEAGTQVIDLGALSARVAPGLGETSERSTQERVWTLLAANAVLGTPQSGLSLDGVPVQGPLVQVLDRDSETTAIENTSDKDALVTVTTLGVPTDPIVAGGNGYRISRSYYDLDGGNVDPARVASGARLVAVLTVTPLEPGEARLMVNDPLPAGFEIDNPNLLRSGDVQALDWLKTAQNLQDAQFLGDRFLAAVDHFGTDPFRLAYVLRAVAPGDYYHPAASVEDMYRPVYRARTDAGRVVVE